MRFDTLRKVRNKTALMSQELRQQYGPSVPDSDQDKDEVIGRLQRELNELRGQARSRGSSAVVLTHLDALEPGSTNGLKILGVVSSMPLPDRCGWRGLQDTRSMKRFVASVVRLARLAGLDHRGAFHYLTTRCLEPSLAEELLSHCPSISQSPPDYHQGCAQAEAYLNQRYAITNRVDKFIARFSSKDWCKDASNMDMYLQLFENMVKEAELLGVVMTVEIQRYYFLSGLPEKLAERVKEKYDPDLEVTVLASKIIVWLDNISENPFGVNSKNRVPVRVASDSTFTGRRDLRKCHHCGEIGHFIKDCPSRIAGKPRSAAAPQIAVTREHENGNSLPWDKEQAYTIFVAGSTDKDGSALGKVSISSMRENGPTLEYEALLDSGATRCICHRRFAEKLVRDGVVDGRDAHMTNTPELTFANDSVMKPLGTIEMCIEGKRMKVLVVPQLCVDLIVGIDAMRANERILHKLIAIARDSSLEDARTFCAAVVSSQVPHGEHAISKTLIEAGCTKAEQRTHCEWPPIELRWKSDARESLKCNVRQARIEARQLEARLNKKSPSLLHAYDEVLANWVGNGWLRELPETSVRYCLRHFPVEKDPNGTTPMQRCRVVVDGSGLSPLLDVKECSHTDITRNLLLWRTSDAFTCLDVSQAYMRVQIAEADGLYLCISWREKFYCFRSLPMGISPSAQALQEIIDTFIEEWRREFVYKGFNAQVVPYMDDLLQLLWSKTTEWDDFRKVEGVAMQSLIDFLKHKGMEISESKTWTSHSDKGGVLGVRFERENIMASSKLDKLTVSDLNAEVEKGLTRRKAVGWIGSLYDPLGIVAEAQVQGRVISSQFSGLGWDKTLPTALAVQVAKWVGIVQQAVQVKVPRWLDYSKIFIFTDASLVGIAAVAVARDRNGQWRRMFARAKLYRKHQKGWGKTSSKIELLALQFGAHVARYLSKTFEQIPNSTHVQFTFGMDSEVNVNRLFARDFNSIQDKWERKTILEVNNIISKLDSAVYHVPGIINPSDNLSRGIWKTRDEDDAGPAVRWFSEDRAVRPQRVSGAVMDSLDSEKVEQAFAAATQVRTTEVDRPVIASLAERFTTEANGQAISRSAWMHGYQTTDPDVQELVKNGTVALHNGVWVMKHLQAPNGLASWPVVVPRELIKNVLCEVHDMAGHFGARKSLMRARESYHWKGMARDIRRYSTSCLICQRVKGNREWTSPPGKVYLDSTPWSIIGVDCVKSDGNTILTVTDWYTRYLFTYVLKRETSKCICEKLGDLFCCEGSPAILITDNAATFCSEEFEAFLNCWQVQHKRIPRYSPWYGGFYEAPHKSLVRIMITLMMTAGAEWRQVLAAATLYHNCRPYEGAETALCPQEIFRGRKLMNVWHNISMDVEDDIPRDPVVHTNLPRIIQVRDRLRAEYEAVWKQMRRMSAREIERRARHVVTFSEGDKVFIWINRLARDKLGCRWEGPYRIEKKISNVVFQVNGRSEHAYNMKRAIDQSVEVLVEQPGLTDDAPVEIRSEPIRKRHNQEPRSIPSKRVRIAALLAFRHNLVESSSAQLEGDMLWI